MATVASDRGSPNCASFRTASYPTRLCPLPEIHASFTLTEAYPPPAQVAVGPRVVTLVSGSYVT